MTKIKANNENENQEQNSIDIIESYKELNEKCDLTLERISKRRKKKINKN